MQNDSRFTIIPLPSGVHGHALIVDREKGLYTHVSHAPGQTDLSGPIPLVSNKTTPAEPTVKPAKPTETPAQLNLLV